MSKKNLARLAALFLAILCIAGCAVSSDKKSPANDPEVAQLAQEYPSDLDTAKKAGVLISMAQLARTPPPAAKNAGPIYPELAQALQSRPLEGPDRVLDAMTDHGMAPAAAYPLAQSALADRSDLMALVHKAASRRECYFQKDWAAPNPASITFPEMAGLHEASRLLTAESLVMANSGKSIDAVKNEALGFRIADHAAAEPTVTGYVLSASIDSTTLASLQKVVYLSNGDPKAAQAVQDAIESSWHSHSLAAAFAGQSAFEQGIVEFLRPGGYSVFAQDWGTSTSVNAVPQAWRAAGSPGWGEFLDANGAFMLRETTRLVTTADKPASVARTASEEVGRDMQSQDSLSHMIAGITMPVSVQLPDQKAQLEAMAQATQAGAAVLVWKAAHSAYPATLSQAMRNVPTDPFDGKPLRYRKEGAGFVIYSVGPWGIFDGGTPNNAPSDLDTAFRYPMPAYLAPAQQ